MFLLWLNNVFLVFLELKYIGVFHVNTRGGKTLKISLGHQNNEPFTYSLLTLSPNQLCFSFYAFLNFSLLIKTIKKKPTVFRQSGVCLDSRQISVSLRPCWMT